ncbi:TPA: hypothetical protein ACLBZX_005636 [Bacillus cereus]|uniref:hypothetical protein n=1 Tax=unclassified Bacillus cereus group TaxID=2750818 RepID=UPI00391E5601
MVILNEYMVVIIAALLGFVVKDFIPAYSKKRAENLATKKDIQDITRLQEETKADFQARMELQKAELNRISKEFELYVAKKHEYYPELYKNIELCYSKIRSLRGIQKPIDPNSNNKEDIKKLISDRGFNEQQKETVLSDWDADKNVAINHIQFISQRINYNKANESYIIAHNFHILHKLYFPKEISSDVSDLLSDMYKLWQRYNPNEEYWKAQNEKYIEKFFEENKKLIKTIDEKIKALFEKLQDELMVKPQPLDINS